LIMKSIRRPALCVNEFVSAPSGETESQTRPSESTHVSRDIFYEIRKR
jgi:hypothetical protein